MTALTAEQIQELLATSKQRGEYDRFLAEFRESNEPGVGVPLDSGVFNGKKAQSVKTGLDNARKRLDEADQGNIRVILHDDAVYLINTAVA